ncbi:MAG TPA: hypothetical protein PKY78_04800 [Candidatus Omnitrophota bacterium]|nr:hypothetical protein [Candidatus Omnitrophota bacterium]
MKKFVGITLSVLMICGIVSGCGGSKISETRPIADVQNEAKTMPVGQLSRMVESYKTVIASKQAQIETLKEKIKAMPITQLLSDEAKALKEDIAKVTGSMQALNERMLVYVKELQAKQTAK